MFDFSIVTSWIHGMLTSVMPTGLAIFIECVVIGVCLMLAYAVIAIIMNSWNVRYALLSNADSARCV